MVERWIDWRGVIVLITYLLGNVLKIFSPYFLEEIFLVLAYPAIVFSHRGGDYPIMTSLEIFYSFVILFIFWFFVCVVVGLIIREIKNPSKSKLSLKNWLLIILLVVLFVIGSIGLITFFVDGLGFFLAGILLAILLLLIPVLFPKDEPIKH